ncbi:circumsporozoite protein-like [Haliotis rubra]|uniref:circumsporozoite protein-like n=1 Tax=Haliotis rubra TaxID=36100 RepID=UPI001EE63487|nr:circumsporozoite protein-like [Haliotis rubra]
MVQLQIACICADDGCHTILQTKCMGTPYYGLFALIAPGLVLLFVLILYCCIKKKLEPRRIVSPSPPQPLATSSGTSGVERSNGEKPITHYPIPPTIKANDPPPPYDSSDPAHPPGNNSNGGQINTRTLPPGTIRQPPSVPAPAWQAPPPGAPPQSDNPPMPQPDPPKTSKPHPPTTSPSDDNPLATAPGASGIHPPPSQ